jgi:hypothetical protein
VTGPVRRTRATAATIVVALGALLLAPAAHTAPGGTRCPHTTLKQDTARADVVFRGVVSKVRPVHGKGGHRIRAYKVAADRVYKSSLVTRSVVVTARAPTTGCALPALHRGTRYIFFATEQGARLVATTATARATSTLTHRVQKRLGSGRQPIKKPPPAATFTKVAGANPPGLARLLAPGAALVIISLLGLVVVGRTSRRARA